MAPHKRMHDIPIGASLKLVRKKRTAWSWSLNAGEEVELVEIQGQPVQFKVKDKMGRTWILDSHDVEMPSEESTVDSDTTEA